MNIRFFIANPPDSDPADNVAGALVPLFVVIPGG
jgi:hypothetical protein